MDGWFGCGGGGGGGNGREMEGDILGMGMLSAIAVGIAEVGSATGIIKSLDTAAVPEVKSDSRTQSARIGVW